MCIIHLHCLILYEIAYCNLCMQRLYMLAYLLFEHTIIIHFLQSLQYYYYYAGNYSKSRQEFQDKIVEKLLDGTTIHDQTNGRVCKTPTEPWIVFTAGVMGAGKSHTMKQVAGNALFPLHSYIVIDPDETRSHFPEYHLYAQQNPERAGELTHKKRGTLQKLLPRQHY